jgi:hypothetical protein
MTEKQTAGASSTPGWRIRIGTWMFYVPFLIFVATPVVVPFLGYTATQSAAIVGAVLVGAEVVWFASIPLLGKQGFHTLKSQAFGLLMPRSGPIGRSRHRFGSGLLVGGLLIQILLGVAVVVAYLKYGAGDPDQAIIGLSFEQQAIVYAVGQSAGVVCVLMSAYVLGADFWARLARACAWREATG